MCSPSMAVDKWAKKMKSRVGLFQIIRRHWWLWQINVICYFLFIFNSNHSSICPCHGNIYNIYFWKSRPVCPLPVVVRPHHWWDRLPAWGFLLVFNSNRMPKMHRFFATEAWTLTNGLKRRKVEFSPFQWLDDTVYYGKSSLWFPIRI